MNFIVPALYVISGMVLPRVYSNVKEYFAPEEKQEDEEIQEERIIPVFPFKLEEFKIITHDKPRKNIEDYHGNKGNCEITLNDILKTRNNLRKVVKVD